MKSVCVVTSARADYGIMKPLISKLYDDVNIDLRIVATGMHLCAEYGSTYKEIEDDGFTIHRKLEIQLASDSNAAMSKSMGIALICFADYFEEYTPNLLILLGDRYEIMAIACAAANRRIPIAHLYGGETTEGAVDEFYRHSITKMSALHFVSCETYRRRVIQLGEQPNHVYNVGALGVENVTKAPLMSLDDLSANLNFTLEAEKYCVVTFHPVTLENDTAQRQLSELMSALDEFPQMRYLITKANSDASGRVINALWENYTASRENCLFIASLGMKRYLSALKYGAAMIGNSSSGILEGPVSKIPTIDIGDRQKGRIRANSVLHCEPTCDDIAAMMKKAFSLEFKMLCATTENPYGDGDTSEKIISVIHDFFTRNNISTKKIFFNIHIEDNLI